MGLSMKKHGFMNTNKMGNYSKTTLNISNSLQQQMLCQLTQAFTKIKSQLKPESLGDKSYEEVVAAAQDVYKQQLTIVGKRNKFMNRNRKPSQSVPQYALAMRELCGDCEYQ